MLSFHREVLTGGHSGILVSKIDTNSTEKTSLNNTFGRVNGHISIVAKHT